MLAQLLLYKILQLLLMMLLGYILVKSKVAKSEDSTILSKLTIYLLLPAVVINAFNVDMTEQIKQGILLTVFLAICVHILFLCLDFCLKKFFRANAVERCSLMYTNCGIVIIPLVSFILGDEWVIYCSAYLAVQVAFLYTHGICLFKEGEINVKKILLNPNIVAVFIGFILLLTGIRLPELISEVMATIGSMNAPNGMLVGGMLMAGIDFKRMAKNKRLYLTVAARLVVYAVVVFAFLKLILPFLHIESAYNIALISYLAAIGPVASTTMMFAKVYGKDAEYATAIVSLTTILCVVTMPIAILFF